MSELVEGGLVHTSSFHCSTRPKDVRHGHPLLVFDTCDHLHVPLTVFAKEAFRCTSASIGRNYVRAILPYFTFLETDEWQVRAGRKWDDAPDDLRRSVADYLAQYLNARMRDHRLGFQLVSVGDGTYSPIRVFLSALKFYYTVARAKGYYRFDNPLIDFSARASENEDALAAAQHSWPRMPDISGVEPGEGNQPSRRRLSDSYFKLEGEEWVPQVIDDPSFFARVLAGGRQSQGWRLREECVTRLLFETGGRISEVVGLTLGDWAARDCLQEASAFSKGSHGRRVKFLRFSTDTAKLLRRYFDEQRRRFDPNGWTLADYRRGRLDRQDLYSAPLFLSQRGTQFSAKSYRERAWKAACATARIDADVHQTRHWYVTMAVRAIHESSRDGAEVQRRLRELIEYMKWKTGWHTLETYEHYFDAARHAEIQDAIHAQLDESLRALAREGKRPTARNSDLEDSAILHRDAVEDDLALLWRLGGEGNGR
jgi:integrase